MTHTTNGEVIIIAALVTATLTTILVIFLPRSLLHLRMLLHTCSIIDEQTDCL